MRVSLYCMSFAAGIQYVQKGALCFQDNVLQALLALLFLHTSSGCCISLWQRSPTYDVIQPAVTFLVAIFVNV